MNFQDVPYPIMFSAYKTSEDYGPGQYISGYNKFLTSYGKSFDLETGIFKAPRKGIFEFLASMHHASSGVISVMKNDISELMFYCQDEYRDNLSFTWIMELQQNDVIQLKSEANSIISCRENTGCIFSGKFLREI